MMEPTRASFIETQRRKRRSEDQSRSVQSSLHLIRQANISMTELQALPGWAPFVALVEQRNVEDRERASEIESSLGSDSYISPESLAKMRQELSTLKTQIRTRTEVLGLPAEIQKSAEKATNSRNS